MLNRFEFVGKLKDISYAATGTLLYRIQTGPDRPDSVFINESTCRVARDALKHTKGLEVGDMICAQGRIQTVVHTKGNVKNYSNELVIFHIKKLPTS